MRLLQKVMVQNSQSIGNQLKTMKDNIKPCMLVYTIVTKTLDSSMANINNTVLMAFIKKQDAIDAIEHLNKRMVEITSSNEQYYELGYLNVFDKQYYN